MVVESGVALSANAVPARLPMSSSFAVKLHQKELNAYRQRVNGTLVGHPAQVLIDHGRLMILEGQDPVDGVTVYEFNSRDAARSWYDSVAYRELIECSVGFYIGCDDPAHHFLGAVHDPT
jgi:uncharacterized protein (DUF1330 family)